MSIENLKLETFVSANTTIDKVKHVSNVTLDWSGVTLDEMQALAQRSVIIKWQNDNRVEGVIPESAVTIRVADHVLGTRKKRAPESIDSQISKLTPEQLQVLMQKIAEKLS